MDAGGFGAHMGLTYVSMCSMTPVCVCRADVQGLGRDYSPF